MWSWLQNIIERAVILFARTSASSSSNAICSYHSAATPAPLNDASARLPMPSASTSAWPLRDTAWGLAGTPKAPPQRLGLKRFHLAVKMKKLGDFPSSLCPTQWDWENMGGSAGHRQTCPGHMHLEFGTSEVAPPLHAQVHSITPLRTAVRVLVPCNGPLPCALHAAKGDSRRNRLVSWSEGQLASTSHVSDDQSSI